MSKHDVIVALDIGTSKICCLIAEVYPDKKIEITGKGFSASRGVKKGAIIDVYEVTKSIDAAIVEAEKIAGFEINSVLAGVKSGYLTSFNNQGAVDTTSQNKIITESDAAKSIEEAAKVNLLPNQSIIQTILRYFSIDGQSYIKNPVGMYADKLGADVHLVIGLTSALENMVRSLKMSDIDTRPDRFVFEPIASSTAVLSSQEKDLGAVFADIGAGTTDIAIYKDGCIQSTLILPIGGNHITYDLAVALKIPLEEAERLKITYGHAMPDEILASDNEEIIQAVSLTYRDAILVSRKKICEIIKYRLNEILGLIKKQVDRASNNGIYLAGTVLTGGVSLSPEVDKLAENIIGLPARIGYPAELRGLTDIVKNPIYSVAVGLLIWGAEYQSKQEIKVKSSKSFGFIQRFLAKLGEIF